MFNIWPMGIYPKYRKPTGLKECPDCGKQIKARGLYGHRVLVHGIAEKTIVKTGVIDTNYNSVGDMGNHVTDISSKNGIPVIPDQVKVKKVISEVGGDQTERKTPDVSHQYTDQDLKILLSRIMDYTYSPKSEVALFNKFDFMDLISDFERRFQCKFDEVRKANQHIQPGKTLEENQIFANKYRSLEYSK